MTFNELSKYRISLPLLSDVTEVNYSSVSRTVEAIIRQQLDYGNDPYEQARWSDVHNPDGLYDLPQPKTEEAMNDDGNIQALTDWIMQTDEMQEALTTFRGTDPHKGNPESLERAQALDEEQSEELSVEELLNGITPMEGDWR